MQNGITATIKAIIQTSLRRINLPLCLFTFEQYYQ